MANGGFGIQPLTTVPELEEAMAAAHSAGRLCVVKFYAPWCTACKAIQPKFKKLARAYPEHDFYEVDFSRCKPLSKHCDITNLPTGIILEQGKLAPYRRRASPHTPRHTRGRAARSRLGSAHETRQGASRNQHLRRSRPRSLAPTLRRRRRRRGCCRHTRGESASFACYVGEVRTCYVGQRHTRHTSHYARVRHACVCLCPT